MFNDAYYGFNGGPLTSIVRQITYGHISDFADFVATGNLAVGPAGIKVPHDLFQSSWLNPSWSNWDFTLARRLPVKVGRGGNARIQIQFYNLFNQIEFSTLNASYSFTDANATGGFGGGNTNANTGKYTTTRPPFNFGVTVRFDY